MQSTSLDEPILVKPVRARKIIDVGNTKFWQLVKDGKIEMVEVGRERLVVYASLKALAQRQVAA